MNEEMFKGFKLKNGEKIKDYEDLLLIDADFELFNKIKIE